MTSAYWAQWDDLDESENELDECDDVEFTSEAESDSETQTKEYFSDTLYDLGLSTYDF